MNNESVATLDRILADCTEQLLAAHGCTAVASSEAEQKCDSDFAATIGFTVGEAGGALALVTSAALVRKTYPQTGAAEVTPHDIGDWIGELSNQLLGRIKNRLAEYSVDINLSTPVVVTGQCLGYVGARSALQRTVGYAVEGLPLRVLFSATGFEDVELDESRRVRGEGIAEGDVELF